MKKIILVDGNNLMYRSYYATLYSGALMTNSKGEATNALYGFTNMINKIIKEENPKYMVVAFDIGKSFRHKEYDEYKAGRSETPDDLKSQFAYTERLLEGMGIKYIAVNNYEADDVIGTITKMTESDPLFDATIVSSDKDLLQLISNETDVKLLKQKDHIRMNEDVFKEEYGIDPIRMIDLKALSGDPSDNIPGVKGIGEITALKLLREYETLENIYENIENIKGALKQKLIDGKKAAFFSKDMCTIYRDVPLNIDLNDLTYEGPNEKLDDVYRELEFYSLMKKHRTTQEKEFVYKELKDIKELKDVNIISYYIESDNSNYHDGSILGMGLYDGTLAYFVAPEMIQDVLSFYLPKIKYTYDYKKNIGLLGKDIENTIFDNMIANYLLNKSLKEDISLLMIKDGVDIPVYVDILKNPESIKEILSLKAKYIFDTRDDLIKGLKVEGMFDLFNNIEMPLARVLAKMELKGIRADKKILEEMSLEAKIKIENVSNTIYNYAGEEFNISSPKQLGDILFDKLGLPSIKKTATKNYSTDVQTLEKLKDKHPIIEKVLEYRNLTKLNGTYLEGMQAFIKEDGLIHTIFKQTQTRTGRLSSINPNLQNIPTRDELGRRIRKVFTPVNDIFLSADYSQIELRVLAHISSSEKLIEAYLNDEDIHTRVASDVYSVSKEEVTKEMRSNAKAVIFGIVYGISGFGLSENLNIMPSEAKKLIDKYLELYPGVKTYMDEIVKEAYDYGSVRTIYNRKRNIDELKNKNYNVRQSGERIALNTPIQGSAADIIKDAMVKIDKEITSRGLKSKMILQVHDELIFDALSSEVEELEELVKNTMQNIFKLKVPLKVDISYGTNWYEV